MSRCGWCDDSNGKGVGRDMSAGNGFKFVGGREVAIVELSLCQQQLTFTWLGRDRGVKRWGSSGCDGERRIVGE